MLQHNTCPFLVRISSTTVMVNTLFHADYACNDIGIYTTIEAGKTHTFEFSAPVFRFFPDSLIIDDYDVFAVTDFLDLDQMPIPAGSVFIDRFD